MSVDAVIAQLQDLGMSGYEAKAYVALVSAGRPLNGYEVAKFSGVPRSTVYETLAKLVGRGAAYEVRGPAEGGTDYLPLPPASLLGRLRREFDDSIEKLQVSLGSVAAPPQAHLIHNLTGREALMARAGDVVAGARRELFVSIWPEELGSLQPVLAQADAAGVDISLMTFGPDETVGRTYHHEFSPPEVVLENLGCRLLVVAADRRDVLIGGFLNGAGDAWGVYADDPAIVLLAVEYVRHDIAMHVLVDRVGADRVREFWADDPELGRLRADRGSPAQALRIGGQTDRPKRPPS
ncbi:MAG TPA: helix-turn-helix domain-containing protein [Acidimicrobiia bacterium]|nr:helix-turn-helix domain-containing protein [Acidimicrobiia bacterium]